MKVSCEKVYQNGQNDSFGYLIFIVPDNYATIFEKIYLQSYPLQADSCLEERMSVWKAKI